MFIRKKKLIIMMILIMVFLAGCNGKIEKKIIGDWKLIKNDEVENYLEINKERILIRTITEDEPKSTEYILTETQNDNFVLETLDSVNGTTEFLFEGHFENDDTLKSVENSEEVTKLIRIDNMEEDISKEKEKVEIKEKETKAKEAKEEKEKKEAKEAKEAKEEKIKEEEKKKAAKAKVDEEEREKKEAASKKTENEHESEETYEWAEGIKETFEADIYEKEYVDSIETIRYEKYEPNGYPQGLYSVHGEFEGIENYIVVVNVKTGDYHG